MGPEQLEIETAAGSVGGSVNFSPEPERSFEIKRLGSPWPPRLSTRKEHANIQVAPRATLALRPQTSDPDASRQLLTHGPARSCVAVRRPLMRTAVLSQRSRRD